MKPYLILALAAQAAILSMDQQPIGRVTGRQITRRDDLFAAFGGKPLPETMAFDEAMDLTGIENRIVAYYNEPPKPRKRFRHNRRG